jgi:hypothetical protein
MRQAKEATTSISRWPSGDPSMFARIFRASQGDTLEIVLILGLNQQPARSRLSGCSLRGCSSSRVPPRGVNSFAPAAVFLGIGLFAPPSARAATWQS